MSIEQPPDLDIPDVLSLRVFAGCEIELVSYGLYGNEAKPDAADLRLLAERALQMAAWLDAKLPPVLS